MIKESIIMGLEQAINDLRDLNVHEEKVLLIDNLQSIIDKLDKLHNEITAVRFARIANIKFARKERARKETAVTCFECHNGFVLNDSFSKDYYGTGLCPICYSKAIDWWQK